MPLNPYTGTVNTGLRGDLGGENAHWGTVEGKEVPLISDKGGAMYTLPDLLSQYGSIDAIRSYGFDPSRAGGDGTDNYNPYYAEGPYAQSLDLFGARPSNDTFSGKDGLRDLVSIAAMASPVVAGAAGVGAATSGAGAGVDATGLGAGDVAFNSAGQLGMSPAALGAGGAAALGLDPTGLGAGDIGYNAQGQLGMAPPPGGTPVTSTRPAAPAGGAPTAGAGASGPATGTAGGTGGQSFVDNLISQMKNNALGLGLMTAGTAASLSAGRTQIPNQQQIQGLGTEAAGVAKQLIAQYQSGTLQPGQQASLDQLTQNTKNQLRQYFASIGQADSTAAVQAMAQVDQQALAMKQQVLDTALQQGLSAIGVAQGPLNTIAQYQLGQDAQLRAAFGNFAGSVGNLFGRNSGTPQQPTTSAQAKQVVTSTQTPTA